MRLDDEGLAPVETEEVRDPPAFLLAAPLAVAVVALCALTAWLVYSL